MLNRFKNAFYGSSDSNTYQSSSSSTNDDLMKIPIAIRRSISFQHRRDIPDHRNTSDGNNSNTKIPLEDRESIFLEASLRNHKIADAKETTKHNLIRYNNIDNEYKSKPRKSIHQRALKEPKYPYSRPSFLQLKTEDEIIVSADHQIRPIILPRDLSRLPWDSGYAECINAGKSTWNEDQAACHLDVALKPPFYYLDDDSKHLRECTMENGIPWVYFGMFDGHAGNAVAVAAAQQLHNLISDNLRQVADLLVALEFGFPISDDETSVYDDCSDKEEDVNGIKDLMVNKGQSDNSKMVEPSIKDKASPEIELDVSKDKADHDNTAEPKLEATSQEDPKDEDQFDLCNSEPTNSKEQNGQQAQPTAAAKTKTTTTTTTTTTNITSNTTRNQEKEQTLAPTKRNPNLDMIRKSNITVESLVIGALESAFWKMDEKIGRDKDIFKMPGGCTAVVSLFILGKLYVCNAGDSRAIVCLNNRVIPMSFDFTPISEKERILRLGMQRPDLLGNEFTHLEFLRRPSRQDIGSQMLYRDASMKGWAMKSITDDDLKIPLVWGADKRSRLMNILGLSRAFGDHSLSYGPLLIKPFLTPEPETRVLPLENDDTLEDDDVLIMGTDGLWDVTSNEEAAEIVKNSIDLSPCAKYRFMSAAQDLVLHSRGGNEKAVVWRKADGSIASLDDISVFVIPLKQYRDEYLDWKRLRGSKNERET